MKQLSLLFPYVEDTLRELDKLNKSLNRITLTGKINALSVASTLFEFTDSTAHRFEELRIELGETLLEENLKKHLNELKTKAQIVIDILIRNLFERTADVGFLATDSVIKEFLTSDSISLEDMQNRLKEYAAKYTVYNEIVIFDTEGNSKVNIYGQNHIEYSNDSIIEDALQSESYVEVYRHSDIFKSQDKTLIYAQKIEQRGENIGVLCLCFRFDDELSLIIKNLSQEDMQISLADSSGVIATDDTNLASNNKNHIEYKDSDYQITLNNQLLITTKTNGYQGFFGIESWYSMALYNTNNNHENISQEDEEFSSRELKTNLLSEKLKDIIERADDLVDDLGDVIINGELIASKKRVYVLSPILDNLRAISTQILNSFKQAILNLEYLVESSLINDVKMASSLAIDIMDRNLYERANDCRWWALTPLFQDELLKDSPDTEALEKTLLYINELYTVYTNLYIYDQNSTIVAASHDQSVIGKKVTKNYIDKVKQNRNTQNYFVSDFESSELYDQRATYIYNASIVNNNKNVGAIGIVFDSEVEFKEILHDSFPLNKKGFAFFVDNELNIISSTHETLKPLDKLDIDFNLFKDVTKHSVHHYIEFEEKEYIIGIALSKGYREYKCEDNYSNKVYAITFIQI
jgi:hypothetical protein